ncbi:hypothetical protein LWI28_028477 [Acer negundo]|uniref:DUF7903 domain-containing protein n=1 Tax=Acer negundo TaxID=4023 RepID=A0AAD5J754_ACENE|nr:hypothetical protein LWI28_028477 [Acer negundo]
MYIVGLDADNKFPSSVHLEPTSVEYFKFKQRMFKNPLYRLFLKLLSINTFYIIEIDEEGEAISRTPSETISSTPWESVAVDVWPNLLSAFEIVRNMLESNNELDEVKPAIFARFGKILFHPNASVRSLIKDRVAETTLRQMKTTFYANTPSSYMENIISGVAPKIGFDLEEDKDIFHILLSDSTKPKYSDLYCKCRLKEDKKLELYKVETNPIREMTKKILCIDKNLDLRLTLDTKRILTSLTHYRLTVTSGFAPEMCPILKVLSINTLYIVGNDEEGETISSTPSETISITPWESVAIDVWPNLLPSFEIVRKNLEYSNELNEEKPALVARFGKILF